MKRIFFLLILMHYRIILPEENMAEFPVHGLADATIILNFNLSNIDNSHNVNNARINTNQNLSQDELSSRDMLWSMQDIKSLADNYKWRFAGAVAISSYGLLYYYAIKGNNYLNRSDLWSSWKKEVSVSAQDLLQEIHHRYEKDFATSLILFIKAVEQEEEDLRWYQSFYTWIQYLHFVRLLPINKEINKEAYEQIAQRLQKLSYYRACLESLKEN